MSRPHRPGTVELTGTGKLYFTNSRGETVPFDRDRYQRGRPWARGHRRDDREIVL